MSWAAPTTEMVLQEFSQKENDTIAMHQNADNLAAILGRVVAEIQGAIRAGGYASDAYLAANPTLLPTELHGAAIDLTRWRLLLSVPALKILQTEDRKEAVTAASKWLMQIRASESVVETPAGEGGTVSANGTWNSENKLQMTVSPSPRPYEQQANQYANPDAPEDTPND